MTLENDGGAQVASVRMAPGSILGLPALVGGKPYSMTAVAKSGATVGFLTRDDFSALMFAEPLLAFMILQVLAAEVRSTRVALSASQASSLRGRALKRKRPTPGVQDSGCELSKHPARITTRKQGGFPYAGEHVLQLCGREGHGCRGTNQHEPRDDDSGVARHIAGSQPGSGLQWFQHHGSNRRRFVWRPESGRGAA